MNVPPRGSNFPGRQANLATNELNFPTRGPNVISQSAETPQRGLVGPQPLYSAPEPCAPGLVLKADGNCVTPIVTRNLFLYNAPAARLTTLPASFIPDPKVHYNYVFLRTSDPAEAAKPIVVPAAQQKTLVYLLNKNPEVKEQEVIEVPGTQTEPEVYFVNYSDGENPELPGGIDLATALNQSENEGLLVASDPAEDDDDSSEDSDASGYQAPKRASARQSYQ